MRTIRQMLSRRRLGLAAGLTTVVAFAAAMIVTGGGAVGATAAQYEYGPVLVTQPAIGGTAQEGQAVTTTDGTWSGASSLTFQVAWQRCDTLGANCTVIPGATGTTYTATSADVGHRLRAAVSATGSGGTTQATSDATGVVIAATGTKVPSGTSIAAADVKLPDRLIVDRVQYAQSPIRSRTGTTARIQVVDTSGNAVSGALVYVLGVPYSRIRTIPEVATDSTGWATVNLVPGQAFPRKGYLVLFVRARVQGQDPLAGSSTRRLVQVTIAPPAG